MSHHKRQQRFHKKRLRPETLALLVASTLSAGVATPAARADGGYGSPVGAGPTLVTGGRGGVDGTAADATGRPGSIGVGSNAGSAGGGGAVDLDTGNGAAGGARGPGDSGSGLGQAPGVAGTTGTTGQTVASAAAIAANVTGGTGGAGSNPQNNVSTSGGGGGGGAGVSASADVTVLSGVTVRGGAGRAQANAGSGGGGVGIFSSSQVNVETGATVIGGAGGGATLTGGAGGGAMGVLLKAGASVVNGGGIVGGAGGAGSTISANGGGGGGAGVQLTHGGTVLNLAGGTITGGAGGAGRVVGGQTGAGGAGVKGVDVTVINAGTITGALSGVWSGAGAPARVQAAAVSFIGGINTLELQAGSVLNGDAVAFSRADTLRLGGDNDATFNVADLGATGSAAGYQGFGVFEKDGASTWTLTGATSETTNWAIRNGALSIASDASLGASDGKVTLDGGALHTTTIMGTARDMELGMGGGTLQTDADLESTGAISGAGKLTKTGAGTLTLMGANTYSGGTDIADGTVVTSLSNLGTGDIRNDGSLVLAQESDVVDGRTIDGVGTLTKQGSGRVVLNGGGAMSGATRVQAGALIINGSFANSAVTVASNATLGGSGRVGATTVQTGGTIAPGNSIGTLRINGNYVQQAGSTYIVEIGGGASDQIIIDGTAALDGGAAMSVVKTGSELYKPGTSYQVLATTGGLSGTYAVSGDTVISPFLSLTDHYDANSAYLTVTQTGNVEEAAETPNQSAAAGGATDTVVSDALLNSPSFGVARNALDQLSGSALASAKGAMLYDSRYSRDLAIDRLRNAFCTTGADQPRERDGRSNGDTCGNDRGAWGQTWGGWGHTNGNGNAGGIDRDSAGFVMGVDVPTGTWRVGVLAGYSRGRYKVDDQNARSDTDDYHLGVYGGTQWDRLALRLGGVYTWHDIDSARDVNVAAVGGRMKADYRANTAQAFAELGYRLGDGPATLEPFVNLAYVNLHTDGFTEIGGLAALRSRGGDTSTTFSTLGLRGSTQFGAGPVDGTLRGLIGWRRAYGDITPKSRVSFQGGDVFTISGVPLGKDAVVIGAGLDLHVTSRVTASVAFDGQFGSGATDRTVSASLRVLF